jgi:hypothetical protein
MRPMGQRAVILLAFGLPILRHLSRANFFARDSTSSRVSIFRATRWSSACSSFGDKAKGADIAVFYNSGQGISVDGSEFLLATDADIKSRIDVKPGNAFDADLAIDHERSKNQARVPGRFAQQPIPRPEKAKSRRVSVGTSLGNEGPDNSLVVFATAPGEAAPDGPQGSISTAHARPDRQYRSARHRDSAGDDEGPRRAQRGNQAAANAVGAQQPYRRSPLAAGVLRRSSRVLEGRANVIAFGVSPATDFWDSRGL